ncbi:ataxin-2-like protein isoform X1 [Hibiscus syriacus]|uniref:PHD finger protein ALFIN-LIKE n=1 Tax=Hibiscus syriacus TaxID=106335 RepID=A0A6A2Y7F2_HIBSY|nr:ataxin-2-like protein isoform X1 [Hibiscus syriacus]
MHPHAPPGARRACPCSKEVSRIGTVGMDQTELVSEESLDIELKFKGNRMELNDRSIDTDCKCSESSFLPYQLKSLRLYLITQAPRHSLGLIIRLLMDSRVWRYNPDPAGLKDRIGAAIDFSKGVPLALLAEYSASSSESQPKYSKAMPLKDEDEDLVEEEEHGETLCGACGENYTADEFWICCDMCEKWFHGKCVKITAAKAEHIKQYKCPSCRNKRARA